MNTVATLIVKPEEDGLGPNDIDIASDVLRSAGAETGAVQVLSEGEAVDILFTGLASDKAQRALAAAFSDRRIDIICQPIANRRKKLLLADMDSTIITVECIDEIADMLGLKDKVAPITEAAMRGELDFEGALKERVALLKGLEREALERVWRERIEYTSGARELIATMGRHGAHTVLVSGGFTFFTERVGRELGFSESHANHLLFDNNNRLSGQVQEPITGAAQKEATLNACRSRLSLALDDVMAVGDGANDIPMLRAAGLGVAFHAKPATVEAAPAAISFGDLTALLYLQGYRRDEFIA